MVPGPSIYVASTWLYPSAGFVKNIGLHFGDVGEIVFIAVGLLLEFAVSLRTVKTALGVRAVVAGAVEERAKTDIDVLHAVVCFLGFGGRDMGARAYYSF